MYIEIYISKCKTKNKHNNASSRITTKPDQTLINKQLTNTGEKLIGQTTIKKLKNKIGKRRLRVTSSGATKHNRSKRAKLPLNVRINNQRKDALNLNNR